MIAFFFTVVAFHVCALTAYLKVGWWMAILLEFFTIFIIGTAIDDYFKRCPVCGKRSLGIDKWDDGNRHKVESGQCRNCQSYVSIQFDKERGGDTYYVEDESGQMEKVVPIWRTSKRRKNYEVSKHRKDGEAPEYIEERELLEKDVK